MRINYLSVTKNCTKVYLETQFPGGLIKTVLEKAGINTNIYTSHSTRVASTTNAYSKNVFLDALMKADGWKSENTFHYSVLVRLLLLSYPVSCYDRQIYLGFIPAMLYLLIGARQSFKSHGISHLGVM